MKCRSMRTTKTKAPEVPLHHIEIKALYMLLSSFPIVVRFCPLLSCLALLSSYSFLQASYFYEIGMDLGHIVLLLTKAYSTGPEPQHMN